MSNFLDYLTYYFLFIVQFIVIQLISLPDHVQKRDKFLFRIVIYISVCLASSTWYCFNLAIPYLPAYSDATLRTFIYFCSTLFGFLFMFTVCAFALRIPFKLKIKDVLFISIVSYTVQHLTHKIEYLIFSGYIDRIDAISKIDSNIITSIKFVVLLFTYLIVDLCFYFFYSKKYKNHYQDSINSHFVIFVTSIILVITIVFNTVFLFYNEDSTGVMSFVIDIFSLLMCLIILYVIVGRIELGESKKEKIALEQAYENKLKQYEISKESIDYINIKCHDLRKQVRFLKQSNETISKEELDKIEKAISIYDTSVNTGNDVLDSILMEKTLLCKKNKIEFTTMIDGKLLSNLKIEDIYSLFCNILDNAIEASTKLDDPNKKTISLVVNKEKCFINITCENYFNGDVQFNNDGSIKTSKSDKSFHGFGTKSIQYVVKNLNGKCRFYTDSDIFKVKVLIPFNN